MYASIYAAKTVRFKSHCVVVKLPSFILYRRKSNHWVSLCAHRMNKLKSYFNVKICMCFVGCEVVMWCIGQEIGFKICCSRWVAADLLETRNKLLLKKGNGWVEGELSYKDTSVLLRNQFFFCELMCYS